uniref:dnaJ homolog subfamily A member 2-like isoform X1 n=2 Tax=Myxine glutinosa TaxID=7769 RepID=UPI00358FC3D0
MAEGGWRAGLGSLGGRTGRPPWLWSPGFEDLGQDEDELLPGFFGENMFEEFLGDFGRWARGERRRGQNQVHSVRVTLEDLYNGSTVAFRFNRDVICMTCKGQGSRMAGLRVCRVCEGRGAQLLINEIIPGIVHQTQDICPRCNGEGQVPLPCTPCRQCQTRGMVRDMRLLEVTVERGMRHGQRLVLHGESDQAPGIEPGDVVLVVQQAEHPLFIRDNDDLMIQQTVELADALCGMQTKITHLDGRDITIRVSPGKVVTPGSVHMVWGEGMPCQRSPAERGNLYIQFCIKFPNKNWLSPEDLKTLEGLLPPRPHVALPDTSEEGVEEVDLKDLSAEGCSMQGRRREAYHGDSSDDEERASRHGLGCNAQ